MFPWYLYLLEEISRLALSVVFLYFLALIAEEVFHISPGFSLELCIQMGISFLFASLLFTAICKASSDNHFAFLHFFSMGMVLIPVSCTMSRTSNMSLSPCFRNSERVLSLDRKKRRSFNLAFSKLICCAFFFLSGCLLMAFLSMKLNNFHSQFP